MDPEALAEAEAAVKNGTPPFPWKKRAEMTPEEKALDNRARKVRAAIGAQLRAERSQAPWASRIKGAARGSVSPDLLETKQELDSSYEEVEVEAMHEEKEEVDDVDQAQAPAPRKKRSEMTPEEKKADNRNRKAREAFRLERERAEAYGGTLVSGRQLALAPKRGKALARSNPAAVPMAAVPLASLVGKKAAAIAERAGAVGLVPLSAVRNLRPGGGGRPKPLTIFAAPKQLATGTQRRGRHGPSPTVVRSLAQVRSLPRNQQLPRLQPQPPRHPPPIVPPADCETSTGFEKSSRKRRFEMTREEKSADNRARKARAAGKTAERRGVANGMLV